MIQHVSAYYIDASPAECTLAVLNTDLQPTVVIDHGIGRVLWVKLLKIRLEIVAVKQLPKHVARGEVLQV